MLEYPLTPDDWDGLGADAQLAISAGMDKRVKNERSRIRKQKAALK